MPWVAIVAMPDLTSPPDGPDLPTRRLRSVLIRVLAIVVVVAAAAAASVVVIALQTTSSDDQAAPPSTTTEPGVSAPMVPTPPKPSAALAPASSGDITGAELRSRLRPLLTNKRFGPSRVAYAYATLDGAKPLFASGPNDVVTPASTMKLLTTTTALAQLGPAARFETRVVRVRGTRQLVLVGGGDPLLTDVVPRAPQSADDYPHQASLQELASRVARVLRSGGPTRVTLSYDDSLFSGPAVSPQWQPTYVPESIVSPITALWANEGRQRAGLAERVDNPSLAAAKRFAVFLRKSGVRVTGRIVSTQAPPDARQLAAVSSAALAAIVEHTLEVSDNEAAEVLLRQAALAAGRPGSFIGGVATVRATMRSLGVDLPGARIYDGSGLSRDDRLPIWALVRVLQTAARPDQPDLRPVLTTLPVAGFNGSLAYRFVFDAKAGLGLVRAKTGTLTGVHGLAGIAMTRDGEPIVFATIANGVPVRRTLPVRAQLDRIAAGLATCC
jgi:serine-type D-Ala-D-Ala carboxypeptidase/endopeptidase (penicillin-binding protein 4)